MTEKGSKTWNVSIHDFWLHDLNKHKDPLKNELEKTLFMQ